MRPADVAAANRSQRPGLALAAAIQALHEAIATEPDPSHKAEITRALGMVMNIQKQMATPPAQAAIAGAGSGGV